MSETSAEKYLGKLISFIVPIAPSEKINADPWTTYIGEVTAIDGTVFELAPCDFNQPHARLCKPSQWFYIRHVHDIKVVRRIG